MNTNKHQTIEQKIVDLSKIKTMEDRQGELWIKQDLEAKITRLVQEKTCLNLKIINLHSQNAILKRRLQKAECQNIRLHAFDIQFQKLLFNINQILVDNHSLKQIITSSTTQSKFDTSSHSHAQFTTTQTPENQLVSTIQRQFHKIQEFLTHVTGAFREKSPESIHATSTFSPNNKSSIQTVKYKHADQQEQDILCVRTPSKYKHLLSGLGSNEENQTVKSYIIQSEDESSFALLDEYRIKKQQWRKRQIMHEDEIEKHKKYTTAIKKSHDELKTKLISQIEKNSYLQHIIEQLEAQIELNVRETAKFSINTCSEEPISCQSSQESIRHREFVRSIEVELREIKDCLKQEGEWKGKEV